MTTLAQTLLETEILEGENLRSQLNQAQRTIKVDEWLESGKLAPTPKQLLTLAMTNDGKN